MRKSHWKRGFTLVELLVVIAIIGLLVAILLPAVQAAREALRRTQCMNNVRQLAIGLHNHHDTHNLLPPVLSGGWGNSTSSESWSTEILPYIEQNNLYSEGHGQNWFGIATFQAVSHVVPLFVCPSSPGPTTMIYGSCATIPGASAMWLPDVAFAPDRKAGVLHYAMPTWFFDPIWDPAMEKSWYNDAVGHIDADGASFASVSDGLSQTILLGETAGAPYTYYRQRRMPGVDPAMDYDWAVESGFWGGPWASVAGFGDWCMIDAPTTGSVYWGGSECVHNCSNAYTNPHSFHPGGVCYVFADGGTRFITNGIDHDTFRRLVMKADGEMVALND